MQTSPIPGRIISRTPSHGLRPTHHRPATRQRDRSEGLSPSGQDLRARVADAFRDMAHGVDGPAAHEETLDFYRAGGQGWTQGLDRTPAHLVRARVAGAFRAMAHGAQAATSQARALRFYRSSGHAWADNLG